MKLVVYQPIVSINQFPVQGANNAKLVYKLKPIIPDNPSLFNNYYTFNLIFYF